MDSDLSMLLARRLKLGEGRGDGRGSDNAVLVTYSLSEREKGLLDISNEASTHSSIGIPWASECFLIIIFWEGDFSLPLPDLCIWNEETTLTLARYYICFSSLTDLNIVYSKQIAWNCSFLFQLLLQAVYVTTMK